jgi:putative glycosyltransferase (TIGR04348 family)
VSTAPQPRVTIISPYLADANNGNWRTAHRWESLIKADYRTRIASDFAAIDARPNVVIVLHARRSHAALVESRRRYPNTPVLLVLTGTDLYADLATSADAQYSVARADALVVLQEDAIRYVPAPHRHKTHIIFQSARALTPSSIAKPKHKLDCVVVGHLRSEKSPQTIFDAVALLTARDAIHITHIGAGLDAALASRAAALSGATPHYRWVNALPHGLTRAAMKRAHMLIHPSILEGGANVIAESITAGTPVIASRMSGNIGMLGAQYDGYFDVGDAAGLVRILRRAASDANFIARINTACKARAELFRPETERARLLKVIASLID